MKIGFPYLKTNEKGDVLLHSSFLRTSSFGILDMEEESVSIIDLQTLDNNQDKGLIDFFVSRGIKTLISPECHPMAAKYFSDNDISIYQTKSLNLIENIQTLLHNELIVFGADNVVTTACGSSCSSCSSKCSSK